MKHFGGIGKTRFTVTLSFVLFMAFVLGVLLFHNHTVFAADPPVGDASSLPSFEGCTVPSGENLVSFRLENPAGNSSYLMFELLDETGSSLYLSHLVEPATAIEQILLEYPLESGCYEMTVKVRAYSQTDLSPGRTTEATVTVTVV